MRGSVFSAPYSRGPGVSHPIISFRGFPLQCPAMPGLPVILNLRGQKCLVVGGGAVALRRARALAGAGCNLITIVAPHIDPALREMPVTIHERPVRETDLVDMRLVVLATDDHRLNDRIDRQARALGVLVNRADEAERGEILFMSKARIGPVTLAIHTGNAIPDAARRITRELRGKVGEHWPAIIEIAGPYRRLIRQNFADLSQRRTRIARLTDGEAVELFLSQGDAAYRKHCEAMCQPDSDVAGDGQPVHGLMHEHEPARDLHASGDDTDIDDFSLDAVTPA